MPQTYSLATIGYQGTTVPSFIAALAGEGVDLLVDVRAVASSRRPGFAKSALTANLAEAGIGYRHLRGLGTPADGRAAARKGHTDEMHEIFATHMTTIAAQEALFELEELVTGPNKVAIMCFEADYTVCHRLLVAKALGAKIPLKLTHLMPEL